MDTKKLELRMYGLVPYNISPIQQGIQFGHAKDEYSLQNYTDEYIEWIRNWKTYIILNGGTTNDNPKRLGTLNQHAQKLIEMNIPISCFHEPDLGDQLTAVTFIVDERVFNRDKYPDYNEDPNCLTTELGPKVETELDGFTYVAGKVIPKSDTSKDEWIQSIGGYRNLKLREFLKGLKLA